MLLCLTEVQMVNVVFVASDMLHLSTLFLFRNNAELHSSCYYCLALPLHSESKCAVLSLILVHHIKLCTISLGVLRFSFIGSIFVCLTFYGNIFQAQIPGILTPDWRAFEVSQMSHSIPRQHLPLTHINPQLHTRAHGSYQWPLNPWRPQGAAL